MKFLFNQPLSLNKNCFHHETGPGNAEATSAAAETAAVHAECREDCEKLATDIETGLTPAVAELDGGIISGGAGEELTEGQTAEDDLVNSEAEAELSPHLPHFESLRTQPGYNKIPEKEFNTIRDSLVTKIEAGSLVIPTDIADDPAKVNDWLTEQIDQRVESHDTDPVARTSEYFAGQGRTVPPAQQRVISDRITAARESGVNDNPTLVDLIKNLLRELGFDFSEEDAANLNFPGSTGNAYSPEGGAAANAGREYNGEAYEGNFEMNPQFYNILDLKEQIPESRKAVADEVAGRFPKDWQAAVYRNAVNNPNFSDNQPILLHNISTASAALWLPGQSEPTFHPATHGYGGVGNVSESGSTPVGSFELYQMADGGKYTSRMGVRGLETTKADYTGSPEEAWSADPAAMGNKNSDARLIRVHQIRGARTAGCTGLPTAVAARLDAAMGSGTGIMERFVSNPSA